MTDRKDRLATWDDIKQLGEQVNRLTAENVALTQERDTAIASHTRAVLRATVRGYTAGENTDAKHWRQRAEAAEAQNERLKSAIRETHLDIVSDLITTFDDLERKGIGRAGRRLEARFSFLLPSTSGEE